MGRLVRKPQGVDLDSQVAGLESAAQSGPAGARTANIDPGDGYLERMVKYVPAEIIAFSMLINAILDQAMKSGGENAAMAGVPVPVIATGALLVGCLLTPLFCWYVRQDGDAWITNAVVSTIALPFWAYLMGAVAFANHHDGNLAAILLMSFTVVSGLVAPRLDKPKLIERQMEAAQEDVFQQGIIVPERPRLVDVLAG
jgi:heme/copper-type cytochrome/quinol oxidase subunit 3